MPIVITGPITGTIQTGKRYTHTTRFQLNIENTPSPSSITISDIEFSMTATPIPGAPALSTAGRIAVAAALIGAAGGLVFRRFQSRPRVA